MHGRIPLGKPSTPASDARTALAKEARRHVNEDAETALLGALLTTGGAIDSVAAILKPEHFSIPVHGRIFAEMQRLDGEGKAVDPITLRQAFLSDPDLIEAGGVAYLADLASQIVTPSAAPTYAEQIVHLWHVRQSLHRMADTLGAIDAAPDQAIAAIRAAHDEEGAALSQSGIAQDGLRGMASVFNELTAHFDAMASGAVTATETGLTDLDRLVGGILPGDVMIVAGRPGMGKSVALRTMAAHVAKARRRVLLFSLEMSRTQVAMGLIQQKTGIEISAMRRASLDRATMAQAIAAGYDIASLPIEIDDTAGLTIEAMRRRVQAAVKAPDAAPIGLVGIDYLQLMSAGPKARDRQEAVSEISRGIKILARDLRVPVVVLSQINRGVESRQDKRPTLADLRESGSIEQDADSVVFLYREEYYHQLAMPAGDDAATGGKLDEWRDRLEDIRGIAEAIVAKNRFGTTGVCRLAFDGPRGLFTNAAREPRDFYD